MSSSARAETDRGQATVELALALPVVVVLVIGVIQVLAVARDQLAVELAAREGARAAAVAAEPGGAARAAAERATGIAPLDVSTAVTATSVTVTVRHRSETDAPIIGRFVGDVDVVASVTMAREPP